MKSTRILASGALAAALALPAFATEPAMDSMDPAPSAAERQAPAVADDAEIARRGFTTRVVEREPVDALRAIGDDASQVAYFTELRNLQGQTVIHRWEYDGQVMGEVAFEVGGPRWRVHSTKQLDPSWTGDWTVKVVDLDGKVLSQENIEFGTAVAKAEESPAAPPAARAE